LTCRAIEVGPDDDVESRTNEGIATCQALGGDTWQQVAEATATSPLRYPGVNGQELYSEGVFVGYR